MTRHLIAIGDDAPRKVRASEALVDTGKRANVSTSSDSQSPLFFGPEIVLSLDGHGFESTGNSPKLRNSCSKEFGSYR